jgi:hypothetical protein
MTQKQHPFPGSTIADLQAGPWITTVRMKAQLDHLRTNCGTLGPRYLNLTTLQVHTPQKVDQLQESLMKQLVEESTIPSSHETFRDDWILLNQFHETFFSEPGRRLRSEEEKEYLWLMNRDELAGVFVASMVLEQYNTNWFQKIRVNNKIPYEDLPPSLVYFGKELFDLGLGSYEQIRTKHVRDIEAILQVIQPCISSTITPLMATLPGS